MNILDIEFKYALKQTLKIPKILKIFYVTGRIYDIDNKKFYYELTCVDDECFMLTLEKEYVEESASIVK